MIDCRKITEFIKTQNSKTIIGIIILIVGIVWLGPVICNMAFSRNDKTTNPALKRREFTSKSDIKPFTPLKFESDSNTADSYGDHNRSFRKPVQHSTNNEKSQRKPLNIYNATATKTNKPLGDYLPYGEEIPCELTVTLQTNSTSTPIIGFVTQNIYNNGKCIIPAGTIVNGGTTGIPSKDHIGTKNSWVLVWRTRDKNNGKELRLKGVALEDGSKCNGRNWDLHDGAYGIKGYTIDNRSMSELKAIALQMISGAGQGMVTSTTTTNGINEEQTFGGDTKSEVGEGLNKSATLYAELMLKHILADGYYVVAPSGTQFYLYVTQTIDMTKAQIAGSQI